MEVPTGARRLGALTSTAVALAIAVSACGSSSGGASSASTGSGASASASSGCPSVVAADTKAVYTAEHPSTTWNGPTTGPKAVTGKYIAFVGGTLQNGGVLGVLQGFRQAAKVLGWTVKVFDGQDSTPGENSALSAAIDSKPAAIAIVGFPSILVAPEVKQANAKHIPLIGWHATPLAGPGDGLFSDVTSLNTAIGTIAGQYAVVAQKGHVHAVIMTDPSIPETLQKAQGMEAAIKACSTSSVLADEINRALAHAKPSGYVTSPHLVTAEDVNDYDGQAGIFDPPNGYAAAYRKIWNP
jgi:ribose transport system substrate-binding protein